MLSRPTFNHLPLYAQVPIFFYIGVVTLFYTGKVSKNGVSRPLSVLYDRALTSPSSMVTFALTGVDAGGPPNFNVTSPTTTLVGFNLTLVIITSTVGNYTYKFSYSYYVVDAPTCAAMFIGNAVNLASISSPLVVVGTNISYALPREVSLIARVFVSLQAITANSSMVAVAMSGSISPTSNTTVYLVNSASLSLQALVSILVVEDNVLPLNTTVEVSFFGSDSAGMVI